MISGVSGMGGGMAAMQRMGPPPNPQEKFNEMDVDGNGGLGLEELEEMAGHISEMTGKDVSAEDVMSRLDADGNGQIEMSEMPDPSQGRPPFMAADGSIKPMDEQGSFQGASAASLEQYLLSNEEEEDETSSLLALLA